MFPYIDVEKTGFLFGHGCVGVGRFFDFQLSIIQH